MRITKVLLFGLLPLITASRCRQRLLPEVLLRLCVDYGVAVLI